MKKNILTRSLLVVFWLSTIFLAWCSLTSTDNSNLQSTELENQISSMNEQILQLNEQINSLNSQIDELTTENEELKQNSEENIDDGYEVNQVNTKDVEQLEAELEKYKTALIQEKLKNSSTNTQTTVSNTTTNTTQTTKEIWYIKKIYTDSNWNRKLEIDYVQKLAGKECDKFKPELKPVDIPWIFCLVNENSKLRTFTVSKNIEIVMQTLSHDIDWSFKMWEKISFDFFKQKFNDTKQYEEHPYNYSNYLKAIPYWVVIENNIITKIEEQYIS